MGAEQFAASGAQRRAKLSLNRPKYFSERDTAVPIL
jgi:hypothetical protein